MSCLQQLHWTCGVERFEKWGAYQGLGARSNGFEAQPRTWVRVDGGVNQKKGGGWKSGNWVFLKSGVFDPGGTPGFPWTPCPGPLCSKSFESNELLKLRKRILLCVKSSNTTLCQPCFDWVDLWITTGNFNRNRDSGVWRQIKRGLTLHAATRGRGGRSWGSWRTEIHGPETESHTEGSAITL